MQAAKASGALTLASAQFPRLLNVARATGKTGKTLAGGPTPRSWRGRAAAFLRLRPAAWEALGPGAGEAGEVAGRGRLPACQRERARARVSAAPSSFSPRRRPPARPPAGPPGLPPPPPPPAPPAAWQAAGCTGGGSRRSHDLSGCLSSSGSYSFPARKQPGLLSKPPWPQGRRGWPGLPALACSRPGRGPRGHPGTPGPPRRARGGGSLATHLVAVRSWGGS